MLKKIIVTVVIIVISIAVYGLYLYNKPAENVVVSNAEMFTTSNELVTKFDNNPSLSTTLLNKVIEVKGIITLVEKGELSSIIVLDENIKCELSNYQLKKTLETGDQVTIKGIYNGIDEMFNEIILSKCQLLKP